MSGVYTSLYPDPLPLSTLTTPDGSFNAERVYLAHAHPQGQDYIVFAEADTGKEIGYNEFWTRVRNTRIGLRDALRAEGRDTKNEIVGIIGDNCIDYPTLVHSTLGLGIPFILLPTHSTRHELGHALRVSQPTRIFAGEPQLELVRDVAKEVGLPDSRVHTFGERGLDGRLSVDALVQRAQSLGLSDAEAEVEGGIRGTNIDSLAYLVFSSGTTGLPKAVMVTHGNLATANFQAHMMLRTSLQYYTPPPPQTPSGLSAALAFLPMYHTYGIHSFGFRNLLLPSTVVFMRKWNVRTMIDVAERYKLSELALVPSAVQQLVAYLESQPKDSQLDLVRRLGGVRTLTSGAAHLAPELEEKLLALVGRLDVPSKAQQVAKFLRSTPVRMTGGYGMSETTSAAMHLPVPGIFSRSAMTEASSSRLDGLKSIPPSLPPPARGATGILLPGQLARIVDGDGKAAPLGEAGELWLAGGNITPGYYRNASATNDTLVHEKVNDKETWSWLKTGDRFWTDGKWFYFADRAKDTLKISGVQVSPAELESVILTCPVVSDVAVAGVSSVPPPPLAGTGKGERVPRAWVVLTSTAAAERQDSEAVEKMIDQWVKERLSKPKWLRGGVEVVAEIPKSPTGKVLRRTLQERYEKSIGSGSIPGNASSSGGVAPRAKL